jgi:ATP-dependent Clp endopeptidase proteolytic subunit ClpP
MTPRPRDGRPITKAAAEADAWIAWAEKDRAHSRLLDVEQQLAKLDLEEFKRQEADLAAGPEQQRIYTFYGEVEQGIVEEAMHTLGVWSRRDPEQPMSILLNSCGGSCIDGIALYDFLLHLRASGHHITITALGEASSMGGIILQAADWRVMGATSELLIHEVSAEQLGSRTVAWIEDKAAYLRKLNRRMDELLAERSTMTLAQIEKRQRHHDWFLDAYEALDLGFIDEVK